MQTAVKQMFEFCGTDLDPEALHVALGIIRALLAASRFRAAKGRIQLDDYCVDCHTTRDKQLSRTWPLDLLLQSFNPPDHNLNLSFTVLWRRHPHRQRHCYGVQLVVARSCVH
jgi:hypothetical protein